MRDHGGDIDQAMAQFGGDNWIDLSTGINRRSYPMPPLELHALAALPTASDMAALESAAANAYGARGPVVALAGAQAAIQLLPRLGPPGHAAILSPSYNEHAASLAAQGWEVQAVRDIAAMKGADLAVVVNPNNPDGRSWTPEVLLELAGHVGRLVVDESFADPHPGLSLAGRLPDLAERVVVLRSFGKFFGLAGLRLGFVLCGPGTAAQLRGLAGPWAVSGPAIVAGRQALEDRAWQGMMRSHLQSASARLAALAESRTGWSTEGRTALFVTARTPDAEAAQAHLARAGIWTRRFPYSTHWLRLGLPGTEQEWTRLADALPDR